MKRNFFTGGCYTLLFFLIFLAYQELFPQVVIKENVEIMPESSLNEGSIGNDPRNPIYINYGGEVILSPIHRTNTSFELWEEELGQIMPGSSIDLGVFPQWNKFIFYLLDPSTGNKYYTDLTDEIVDEYGSSIDFYPSHISGEPYPYNPEDWWAIDLYEDYSLAAMPPPEILNYWLNPFIPSEPLEIPTDGSLYAIIYSYTDANDELWMDLPSTQMVESDLKNHDGEEIEIGDMTAGDLIRFFLISSNTIVGGNNLYAWIEPVESPAPNGDVLLWRLYFEDWTDLYFDDIEVDIYLRPNEVHLEVIATTVEPEELAPGDTAKITFKKRYLDGTLEDFPEWQTFEVGIDDGCVLGNLLVDGETGPYFFNISQPVYFIADSSADSGTVNLKVGLVEAISGKIVPVDTSMRSTSISEANSKYDRAKLRIKEKQQKSKLNKLKKGNVQKVNNSNVSLSSCFIQDFRASDTSHFSVKISTESILLGETKYYQAKYNSENKLVIEEVTTPELDGGLTSDVWGDNPVSVVECDSCGKKMGVYWEKKYPVWGTKRYNGDEYLGKDFNGMQSVPTGIIRIIGRYWYRDSVYVVKLNAKTAEGDTYSIKINVTKPSILVSDEEAETIYGSYSKTRDVHDKIINIDSLCIYYGGLIGISPQIVKGQIHKETAKMNFNGTGWGFAPTYRYEPYTTQTWHKVLEDLKSNPYFIFPNTEVSPPSHQHLQPMQYFSGDTITVWQIVNEFSHIVDKNNNFTLYGEIKNDTLDFGNYSSVQKKYYGFFRATEEATIFDSSINKTRPMTFEERADSSNKRMVVYLRNEFPFKDNHKTKGMINMIAQTRIASSYGLLQALYTTAISNKWKYPSDEEHNPEYLNEVDTNFVYSMIAQRAYLKNFENKNSWPDGYEKTIKEYVLKKWNGSDYSKYAIKRSQLFIPQR